MKLPSITINDNLLSKFGDAIKKEWITTNGLGGYASSTVLGINTRKYHGLLVAALYPPRDRWVCMSKLDEELGIKNKTYPIAANEFQDVIFPQGYRFLKEFSLTPFPRYIYSTGNVDIEKTIFMPREKNAVVIAYKVVNKNDCSVSVKVSPMLSCRHFHSVIDRWKLPWKFAQSHINNTVTIHFDTANYAIIVKAINGYYHAGEKWIEKIYYREEANRGESCLEDYYQPGYFDFNIKAKGKTFFAVIAATDKKEENARKIMDEISSTFYDVEILFEQEKERLNGLLTTFYEEHKTLAKNDWLDWSILAADTFIVKDINAHKAVIAGYHWFENWGRDTFISLPGLMLVTGRFKSARKVFSAFMKYCKHGLIPNFLPDAHQEPAYNSVDATLWFNYALLQHLKYTNDFKFIREQLWENLKEIIESHIKGVDGIRMDSDGLLSHGPQLTWMDTAIDGRPVTPRAGKAVEVQALWYCSLKLMQILAKKFGEKGEAERYAQLAENTRKAFNEKFWNANANCLFDVVDGESKDKSIRPNQIITVALDFQMLDRAKNEKIVDVVQSQLLTPYGLRTLAKNDPHYKGTYAGDRRKRDEAYHNGTVWAWLLGFFTKAFLKTKGYADYRREYAFKNFLLPLFKEQIFEAGLGTISEIFDGDPPHAPKGCISQAWSVAEPLRAYVEDIMLIRPRYEKEILAETV